MEMINTTHSTEYTGIPANDQYQVALRIFTARKGPEEPPSQYFRRLTQEIETLTRIGGVTISPEVMAIKFADSLGTEHGEFRKKIWNSAILGYKKFPENMGDILPKILKFQQTDFKTPTITNTSNHQNVFSIYAPNDNVERERETMQTVKRDLYCYNYNNSKCKFPAQKCKYIHKKVSQQVLSEQPGYRFMNDKDKAKCDACGNAGHTLDQCSIIKKCLRALKDVGNNGATSDEANYLELPEEMSPEDMDDWEMKELKQNGPNTATTGMSEFNSIF